MCLKFRINPLYIIFPWVYMIAHAHTSESKIEVPMDIRNSKGP